MDEWMNGQRWKGWRGRRKESDKVPLKIRGARLFPTKAFGADKSGQTKEGAFARLLHSTPPPVSPQIDRNVGPRYNERDAVCSDVMLAV